MSAGGLVNNSPLYTVETFTDSTDDLAPARAIVRYIAYSILIGIPAALCVAWLTQ
jgi:hypothetical protein